MQSINVNVSGDIDINVSFGHGQNRFAHSVANDALICLHGNKDTA